MRIQSRLILTVVALLFPLCLSADSSGPFSFSNPTIRIASTDQDGTAEFTLRSTDDQSTTPTLRDFDLPHPPSATVTFELIKDPKPQTKNWRFRVVVTGLSPANAMQQRYAVIEYADHKTQTIPYFLTNQSAGSFTWTISKPPDPWVHSDWLPGHACTAFVVTPKDSAATGLTLNSSNLVEQSTKQAITVQDLRLCRDDCTGKDPIDLPANMPSKLQLCTTKSFHGNFRGVVTLASLQKPDGDTILQNLDLSSFFVKLVGVIVIGVGVFLAWWSKVWARARLDRDQALMPAVVMRTQLRSLQEVLSQLRQPYRAAPTNLNNSITALLGELDDTVLDQHLFLPPKFPSPYGYSVDAAGYKAYLEARNPRIQLFSALIRQGVVPSEAEDNGTLTAAQQALIVTGISDIDRICTNVPQPTADQALVLLQPILTNLHNALFPPPAGAPRLLLFLLRLRCTSMNCSHSKCRASARASGSCMESLQLYRGSSYLFSTILDSACPWTLCSLFSGVSAYPPRLGHLRPALRLRR